MRVSLFGGLYDVEPTETTWSWEQLRVEMELRRVEKRETVGLWSPCSYGTTKRRGAGNVEKVYALTLDIDEVDPGDVVQFGAVYLIERAFWLFDGHARAVHTTWSHTPDAPRYRVVLPLGEPVPAPLWPEAWAWAVAKLPDWLKPDPACKDPSRMFWRPAAPPDAPGHRSLAQGGRMLVIPLEEVQREKRERERKARERRERLRRRVKLPPKQQDIELRARLRDDPVLREKVGVRLGGRVTGAGYLLRVVGIACPACGRASVWFPLEPRKSSSARCNHVNSCGWWGWLEDLWTRAN